MEILLAFIWGAALGSIAHFALPARDTRGFVLAPVVGAVAGGATWLALTWAGLTTGDAVLWLSAAIAPFVVFPGVALLTRARRSRDAREEAGLRTA